MTKTYSVISILGAVAMGSLSIGCAADDGEPTIITPGANTGGTAPVAGAGGTAPVAGAGGTAPVAGAGGTAAGAGGTAAAPAGQIFSGAGTWVQAEDNTVAVQGSFFVLEDSMKDGVLVSDLLQHTDLTPDEFSEDTAAPCVNGTVAPVTAEDGVTECGFSTGDEECDWDTWGGGLGFNLNETGGEDSVKSAWDATANGVTGFKFNLSGDYAGTIRFKAKMEGSDEDFCTTVTTGAGAADVAGDNSVDLANLVHMCWGTEGTETLDVTKLVQLEWQLVTAPGTEYAVTDFCVNNIEFY